MKALHVIATTLTAIALFCRVASADPLGPRDRFERGVEAFEHGEYGRALEEFTASYELAPIPEVLHNIALTQKELGLLPESLATFERYVTAASARPGGIDPERTKLVTSEMAELRTSVGELRFMIQPAGSSVLVDGKPVVVERPSYVWPGEHDIDVRDAGYLAAHRHVTVAAGLPTTIPIRLEPVLSATTAPEPEPTTNHTTIGPATIVTGSAAAAALAGGATLGLLALDKRADYRAGCQAPETCDRSVYDAGRRMAIGADVLFGAAAALSIVTVVLLTRDAHSHAHSAP